MSDDSVDSRRVLSRADLLALGYSAKRITKAVKAGEVTRLRRDHYVIQADADADKAIRIGGHLSCVSALAILGDDVFVIGDERLHVQVQRTASRLRAHEPPVENRASRRAARWNSKLAIGIRLHWDDRTESLASSDCVALADAIRQFVRCQPARQVVATLDSLLHHGIITHAALEEVFDGLPHRHRVLLKLLDARSEAGTESLVRLMLRRIGASIEVQVRIASVGRVDFVVDGWLIIECDSKAYHEGWDAQRRDRRRDQAAAEQGYTTVRLLAEDILYRHDEVFASLRRILAVSSRAAR